MTIERTEIGIGKMRIDVVDDQALYNNLVLSSIHFENHTYIHYLHGQNNDRNSA